jgi:hypothetical protein
VASLRALVLAARAERDRFAGQVERLRHIIREFAAIGGRGLAGGRRSSMPISCGVSGGFPPLLIST